jgi:hypothetical protein
MTGYDESTWNEIAESGAERVVIIYEIGEGARLYRDTRGYSEATMLGIGRNAAEETLHFNYFSKSEDIGTIPVELCLAPATKQADPLLTTVPAADIDDLVKSAISHSTLVHVLSRSYSHALIARQFVRRFNSHVPILFSADNAKSDNTKFHGLC